MRGDGHAFTIAIYRLPGVEVWMPISNRSFATPEKAAIYRAYINSSSWYAACEAGHFFWAGPDRLTFAEAEADALNHNERKHGCQHPAIVLCNLDGALGDERRIVR